MNNLEFDLCKDTIRKMVRIGMLHRNIFERNISNMGIHHSQHHLLMYIAKEGEVISQKLLAEKFCVTPAAIARTLKELEIDGYIERCSIENDSRCNKIVITEKGREIVRKSQQFFKEVDISAFQDFLSDDFNYFNALLDKMQARLLEEYNENVCVRKLDEKQKNN